MKLYIAKCGDTWAGFVATDSGRITEAAYPLEKSVGKTDSWLVRHLESDGYSVKLERQWNAEDWTNLKPILARIT
jgi:hypothetical protein